MAGFTSVRRSVSTLAGLQISQDPLKAPAHSDDVAVFSLHDVRIQQGPEPLHHHFPEGLGQSTTCRLVEEHQVRSVAGTLSGSKLGQPLHDEGRYRALLHAGSCVPRGFDVEVHRVLLSLC